MHKPKVIVILGQTATGKSDLAVKIALLLRSGPSAHKFGGEIISADSRQVYKNLDIGTGKITPDTKNYSNFSTGQVKKKYIFTHKGIPHHLIDVANPKHKFTVAEYKNLAEGKIKEIIGRGKMPIICGGTGFYIDAVTKGIVFPEVPPNLKLRKDLEKESVPELFKMLKKLDSGRAKTIDPKNRVRLIRAIEIVKALGKVPKITAVEPLYKFIKIGLYLPEEKLKEKIRIRLFARIRGGMVQEAKKLHKNGVSWKRMQELGLEYRYLALYLQNKISKKEMLEKLSAEIYQYARRQMTWFKRDKQIKWFDARQKDLVGLASNLMQMRELLRLQGIK